MATGDVINPNRVRLESNERLDLVDADSVTQQARQFWDAGTRSLLFSIAAVAGAPVGLILTGGSVLVNPTLSPDGRLRVNSELLVALDADGRFLIKPAGTTMDVAIPAAVGPCQVYLYFLENAAVPAKRRAIAVTLPYSEFTTVPNTQYLSTLGVWVRPGGLGGIVQADVIGGLTTNLVFLGIATNTVGTVVFDTSGATNRLSTVVPAFRPTSSGVNGGARTLHEQLRQALYEVARTRFTGTGGLSGSTARLTLLGGSAFRVTQLVGMTSAVHGQMLHLSSSGYAGNNGYFTITQFVDATTVDVWAPAASAADVTNGLIPWAVFAHNLPGLSMSPQASTNYGAYTESRRGLDEVDRATRPIITIGDGFGTFGTFDTSEFPDGTQLLQAAFNYLNLHGGGTLHIKDGAGVALAADLTLPLGSSSYRVIIEGNGLLNCGPFKIITLNTQLELRDISVNSTSTAFLIGHTFAARNVRFFNDACAGPTLLVDPTNVMQSFRVTECTFGLSASGTDLPTTIAAISLPLVGVSLHPDVVVDRCVFNHTGSARTIVSVDTNGQQLAVKIADCSFWHLDNAAEWGTQPSFVQLLGARVSTTVGCTVSGCSFSGNLAGSGADANFIGVQLVNANGVEVADCTFSHMKCGVYVTANSGNDAYDIRVDDNRFNNAGCSNSAASFGVNVATGLRNSAILSNAFSSSALGVVGGVLVQGLVISGNDFLNSYFSVTANNIGSEVVDGLVVTDNVFHCDSGLTILAPFVGTVPTYPGVAHVLWSNNSHSGYANAAVQNFAFGVNLKASSLAAVVTGNSFVNLQQGVTYTGSSDGMPRIVLLEGYRMSFTVASNVVSSCGKGYGLPQSSAVFLSVRSFDPGLLTVESGAITGNTVGDGLSHTSFFVVDGNIGVQSIVISDNSHVSGNGFNMKAVFVGCVNGGTLVISNNSWYLVDSSDTTDPFAVAGSLGALSIVGNVISVTRVYSLGHGFSIDGVTNLIFHGNTAQNLAALGSADPVCYTHFPGTLPVNANGNTITGYYGVPADGVDWGGAVSANIHFRVTRP